MRTLGVDLASAAEKTAWCLLEWREGGAEVVDLQLGADDAALVEAARSADHVGVDAPCGWPRAFVQMLHAAPKPMITTTRSTRNFRKSPRSILKNILFPCT